MKKIVDIVKTSFKEWSEDKASRLAAALAYYTVFSIPPLLIIVLAIVGQFFNRSTAQDQLMLQIQGLIGDQGAGLVKTMLENASKPADSLIASIISVVTLLLGASGVFGELRGALNTIWEVEPKPGRGFLGTLKDRFLSFTMVLGVGFLLLVSLIISTALSALNSYLAGGVAPSIALQILNAAVSFGVVTLLFALIFKIVPDAEIAWRDVWLGALVTALLFTLGKFAIGLYLGRSSVSSTYGAAGSLIVILLWVYYSAQILFLGAEFTQVYANKYGSRIRPDEDAEPVTEGARAQQGIPRREKDQPKREPATAHTTQTADAKLMAASAPAQAGHSGQNGDEPGREGATIHASKSQDTVPLKAVARTAHDISHPDQPRHETTTADVNQAATAWRDFQADGPVVDLKDRPTMPDTAQTSAQPEPLPLNRRLPAPQPRWRLAYYVGAAAALLASMWFVARHN